MLSTLKSYVLASCLISPYIVSASPFGVSLQEFLEDGSLVIPESAAFDKRDGCHADNCLRAVRASNRDPAVNTAFCQSYLSLAPFTVITTSYSTTTPEQPTTTSRTGTTTSTVGYVCTITAKPVTVTDYLKRDVTTTPVADQIAAACPSANGLAQNARISTACSCFLARATPATVTTTIVNTVIAATPKPTTLLTSFASTSTISICTATVTMPVPTISVQVAGSCANMPAIYTTPNGKKFASDCANVYVTTNTIDNTRVASFASCIRHCALLSNCIAISWLPQNANYNCAALYALAGPPTLPSILGLMGAKLIA